MKNKTTNEDMATAMVKKTEEVYVMDEYKDKIGKTIKDLLIIKRYDMPDEDDNGLLAPESGLITDSEGVDREDSYKPMYQNKGIVIAKGPQCVEVEVGDIVHWSLDNYPRSTIYFDKTDSSAWTDNNKKFSPYVLTYESYGVDYVEPAE
jgi:plastocyanin